MKKALGILLFLIAFLFAFSSQRKYVTDAGAKELITNELSLYTSEPQIAIVNADYEKEGKTQVFHYILSNNDYAPYLYYGTAKIRSGKIINAEEIRNSLKQFESDIVATETLKQFLEAGVSVPFRVFVTGNTEKEAEACLVLSEVFPAEELQTTLQEYKTAQSIDTLFLNTLVVEDGDLVSHNLDVLGCFFPYYRENNELFHNDYMREKIAEAVRIEIR